MRNWWQSWSFKGSAKTKQTAFWFGRKSVGTCEDFNGIAKNRVVVSLWMDGGALQKWWCIILFSCFALPLQCVRACFVQLLAAYTLSFCMAILPPFLYSTVFSKLSLMLVHSILAFWTCVWSRGDECNLIFQSSDSDGKGESHRKFGSAVTWC